MFYVAYFKKGAAPKARPVTFLFSGGPGSWTVWSHMGAFGLKWVMTADNTHSPAAPYAIVDNDSPSASYALWVRRGPGRATERSRGGRKVKAMATAPRPIPNEPI
jgi:hypothetical protein